MASRPDQIGAAITTTLAVLPAVGEPGFPSADALVAGFTTILRARAGPAERLTLASAAVMSLDPETAEELAEAVLHDLRTGAPVPPFLDLRDEARSWAAWASPSELRAYLAAIWGRLPEPEKTEFLSAVRPKRRAA